MVKKSAAEFEMPVTQKLEEYNLMSLYREGKRASVDEFNEFLLALHGDVGRYWALVVSPE
jgi:hypothetical protein